MKPIQLSDKALLQQTLLLVKREKEILSDILLHLQEVQRRRLYCDRGFGSLFQYCVKELGYTEDQSYRRINALKLVKEMPEIQEQIASGELTLSTLGVAQSLFKADSSVNKKEVIRALHNKSKREAEVIVREFSPQIPERKKEVRLFLNQIQEERWQAVKSKLAHCNLKEEEILERICDFFLAPKPAPTAKTKENQILRSEASPEVAPKNTSENAKISAPPRSLASPSTAIPAHIKRKIHKQNQSQCTNCKSVFALQIDHKIPRALGGTNHPKNLRLLCRACNQREAIRIFGMEKMQKYLKI